MTGPSGRQRLATRVDSAASHLSLIHILNPSAPAVITPRAAKPCARIREARHPVPFYLSPHERARAPQKGPFTAHSHMLCPKRRWKAALKAASRRRFLRNARSLRGAFFVVGNCKKKKRTSRLTGLSAAMQRSRFFRDSPPPSGRAASAASHPRGVSRF